MQIKVCINCILCGTSAHFIHVHLLSRLLGAGGLRGSGHKGLKAALSFSGPSHQRALPPGPWADPEETEREPPLRAEATASTSYRRQEQLSKPLQIFRVPNPKRLVQLGERPPSSIWETVDQAGARKTSEPEPICHHPHVGTNNPPALSSSGDSVFSSTSSTSNSSTVLVNIDNYLQMQTRAVCVLKCGS